MCSSVSVENEVVTAKDRSKLQPEDKLQNLPGMHHSWVTTTAWSRNDYAWRPINERLHNNPNLNKNPNIQQYTVQNLVNNNVVPLQSHTSYILQHEAVVLGKYTIWHILAFVW